LPWPPNNAVVSVFGCDPYRIGAGENFARELSTQLAARGWRSVLCFLKAPPEPVRRFLDLPNTSVEVIEDSWRLSARATTRLFAVLRAYRPRVLHLHFTGFLSAYPWVAKLSRVERVYFTDQASRPEGFIAKRAPLWKRTVMRVINSPLNGVISVSEYGYRSFAASGLAPKNRFHIIYNSVDVSRAELGLAKREEFRRRYGIPEDRLVVAQVGQLIAEKGPDDLLAAAHDVVAAEPQAHFVLAGDGANRPNLEKAVSDLGIGSHVTFTGVVEDPLGEGLYAAVDVVCQMSRWEEVFGYVNAEAMATGKPVVGTRVGGIPELIEDGKTGYLTARRDTGAMAARILELLRDPQLRRRMGEAGKRAAKEKFSLQTNVAKLLELYGI
jgi:glycosyltransferase involved in cell wall biosynthesis